MHLLKRLINCSNNQFVDVYLLPLSVSQKINQQTIIKQNAHYQVYSYNFIPVVHSLQLQSTPTLNTSLRTSRRCCSENNVIISFNNTP